MKLLLLFLTVFCLTATATQKTFLVFGGKTGWIGKKIVEAIKDQGHTAVAAQSRLEDRTTLEQEIAALQPDYIINAAGAIGPINVDWCEDNKLLTLRANIIGALNLADAAASHNIHLTVIGTGCIYNYDTPHPMYSGKGFKEDDAPNCKGAFYTDTKVLLEQLLAYYPNLLNLRVRLPIASDYHRRNLFVKLSKYAKVVNIPNSITVLDELVPLIPQMIVRGLTGTYNFTNPGVISHNEILELYKRYIDPNFTYVNFTLEEQSKVLKSGRCYNELDVSKLLQEFPHINPVKIAIEKIFQKLGNPS